MFSIKDIYDSKDGEFVLHLTKNGKHTFCRSNFDNPKDEGIYIETFEYSNSFDPGASIRINPIYLPGKDKVTIILKAFNKNGTPARAKNGSLFEDEIVIDLENGYARYSDILGWGLSNFDVGIFERKDYYITLTVKDNKGKVLPTTGNKKVSFYIEGKYH